MQIDFDGLQQRIIAVPGVPERQYSQLRAGVAGTVYYLEASGARGGGGFGGQTLQRYRLEEARGGVCDGRSQLRCQRRWSQPVYRAGGGVAGAGRGGRGGGEAPAPALFIVDADRQAPQPGQGRINVSLRMYLDPKEEFKQIFNEGWRNQRDYLYVQNMHGSDWPKMKEMRLARCCRT
ncbi:MAG: hypothetical protein U0Y68_03795 [Blastocatellia bacterium]